MANPVEQCLVALTQMLQLQQNNQAQNARNQIEKDLQYLQPFKGEKKTLPSFIDAVEATLQNYPNDMALVFQLVLSRKIEGTAKNLLTVSPPNNWDECKTRLKQHYKSSKDQMTLTREITSLKVSSILDLDNKIRYCVEDIVEFVAFNDNSQVMKDIFCGMLVQRIKELVSGSLAYAIMNKFNLTEIRQIVNSFIGLDNSNLNLAYKNNSYFNKNNNKSFNKKNNNINFNNNHNNSHINRNYNNYNNQNGLHRRSNNSNRFDSNNYNYNNDNNQSNQSSVQSRFNQRSGNPRNNSGQYRPQQSSSRQRQGEPMDIAYSRNSNVTSNNINEVNNSEFFMN